MSALVVFLLCSAAVGGVVIDNHLSGATRARLAGTLILTGVGLWLAAAIVAVASAMGALR